MTNPATYHQSPKYMVEECLSPCVIPARCRPPIIPNGAATAVTKLLRTIVQRPRSRLGKLLWLSHPAMGKSGLCKPHAAHPSCWCPCTCLGGQLMPDLVAGGRSYLSNCYVQIGPWRKGHLGLSSLHMMHQNMFWYMGGTQWCHKLWWFYPFFWLALGRLQEKSNLFGRMLVSSMRNGWTKLQWTPTIHRLLCPFTSCGLHHPGGRERIH